MEKYEAGSSHEANPDRVPSSHSGRGTLPPFTVLMSVYHLDHALYLRESLESVFAQTLPPTQVVLVCDGPVGEDLDAVIAEYSIRYPQILEVRQLAENGGLGKALSFGLSFCQYDLVARMDSDDIAHPTRFERQISYLNEHPETDVLSCSIDEFTTDPHDVVAVRCLPEEHIDLARFARKRSPVNHPTVVFRRPIIHKAGGYLHFPLFEDYHLFARIIMAGGHLHSLPEVLLSFRMSNETYGRRRGWTYACNEIRLQRDFRRIGFTSGWEYVRNIILRVPPRLFPRSWLPFLYRHCLRTKPVVTGK